MGGEKERHKVVGECSCERTGAEILDKEICFTSTKSRTKAKVIHLPISNLNATPRYSSALQHEGRIYNL